MIYHQHNMNIQKSYQIQLFITDIEYLMYQFFKVNSHSQRLFSTYFKSSGRNMNYSEIALIEGIAICSQIHMSFKVWSL